LRNDGDSSVDAYTKTPNQRKIIRKTQKERQPTKTQLKEYYDRNKLSGGLVFTFVWPGESNRQGSQIAPLPLEPERKTQNPARVDSATPVLWSPLLLNVSGLVFVSKATGLGDTPIALRLWILQRYGLVQLL